VTVTVTGPEREASTTPEQEETLVADLRHALTPSQVLERKLGTLLKTAPLPVSQLQSVRLPRR
jgi:hypothetical protein